DGRHAFECRFEHSPFGCVFDDLSAITLAIALRGAPEARSERTRGRLARVSALRGDEADCVFLFECEPWRERAEPPPGATEGRAAFRCRRVAGDGGKLSGEPRNTASAGFE